MENDNLRSTFLSKWRYLIPLVVVLILAAVATFYVYQSQKIPSGVETAAVPTQTPSSASSQRVANFPGAAASAFPSPSAQPVAGSDTLATIGITLKEPFPGNIIFPPVSVSGEANVYEGVVKIRVKDSNGELLGQGQTTACMGETACEFATQVSFKKPMTETGILDVYSPSPKDGFEQFLQSIVIRFR